MQIARIARTSSLILGSLVGPLSTGCAEVVHGNGTVRDEERAVPAFARVEVRASLVTAIVKAEEPGVRLQADENLLGLLVVRVDGDTLVLDVAKDGVALAPTAPMTAIVTTDALAGLDAQSDEPVSLEGWQVPTLAITSSGAGGVSAADLTVGDLSLEASGAGDVVLAGSADVLRLDASGAGDVDASDLVAARVDVELSGAGDVSVQTTGTVDGALRGEGDLIVTGDPERIDVEDMGAGGVSIR